MHIQAVLPLRGKILNVERARFDKMLSSEMIGTLIMALGTGIGRDEFNIDKLRYHKIILMTDADVDGSHIRTLLLTFFYPADAGDSSSAATSIIAQPPLFKVARGKSETYIKNERALDDYLVAAGLEESLLTLGNGEICAGQDLAAIVEEARQVKNLIGAVHSRYNQAVVEQAAIAGALNAEAVREPSRATELAAVIARRLDAISDEIERGWEGSFDGEKYLFSRTVRGVKEVAMLDGALLASSEARKLDEYAARLGLVYDKPAIFRRKSDEVQVPGPAALFEAVKEKGAAGIKLQRYKGLGEMNAEQLWETTLDRNARSLLQVKIKEVDEADDIFVKLMGDVVEPRREFIQENALSATVDA